MKVPKYTKEWTEASDRFEVDCSICIYHGENINPDDVCEVAPCIANECGNKFDKLRNLLEMSDEANWPR